MAKSNLYPEQQLDVTFHLSKGDGEGYLQSLTDEEKNRVIHKLIEQYDGVQDVALGTIVFDIPVDDIDDDISVQLWVHEWE